MYISEWDLIDLEEVASMLMECALSGLWKAFTECKCVQALVVS